MQSITVMFHLQFCNVYTGAVAIPRAAFGRGVGVLWVSNARCTGSESRLINCPLGWPWGQNTNFNPICNDHSRDAGVRCVPDTSESQSVLIIITIILALDQY